MHRHLNVAWCKNKRALGIHSGWNHTLRFAPNDSLQPADRFIIPKTTERRTYDRFIRIQSESLSTFLWLFIESSTRGKPRQGRPPTKEKKSVAYVWRGSPPFLIESRLGAYILSSIGAVGGESAAKRVETATGGCRKGVQKGVVRGVSALRIEWGLFANANFKITNF